MRDRPFPVDKELDSVHPERGVGTSEMGMGRSLF
jgi:hypothetical protein